ncbi:MAG: hypothetical protein ACXVS6_08745 [Solirubrobacteraceae bacterium]
MGRPKQASAYLQTAQRKAPELSEARINLDAAQQCNWALLPGGSRGNPPVIADPPFWREDQSGDWTTDADGNPVQVASSVFDLSQTANWTPVAIKFPTTPQEGGAMQDYVTGLEYLFLESAEWAFPDYCDGGPGTNNATAGVPDQNSSPACPKALNKLPAVEVGDPFSFSVHCEEIEFEVATKGWLGAFANVTFNPKAGTVTVFTGAQAGALGQQARVGAYMSAGPNGLTDSGMRVNESTSGPSFMTQSHTVNFSVAGTVPFSE